MPPNKHLTPLAHRAALDQRPVVRLEDARSLERLDVAPQLTRAVRLFKQGVPIRNGPQTGSACGCSQSDSWEKSTPACHPLIVWRPMSHCVSLSTLTSLVSSRGSATHQYSASVFVSLWYDLHVFCDTKDCVGITPLSSQARSFPRETSLTSFRPMLYHVLRVTTGNLCMIFF